MAADAKLAMWPPTLVLRLARTTMAMAFQRMKWRMRCSSSKSPGSGGCRSTGMVFT